MNIYADRGNLLLLERRCALARDRLRAARPPGSATRSTPTPTTSSTSAAARTATSSCAPQDLADSKRDALHAAAERGAVLFGVCGGYQLLGHGYELGDERLPGVGLVDLETVREDGPAADRQRRDRGRPDGRRPARARRLREPRRPHAARRRRASRSAACSRATATTAARRRRGRARRPRARCIGTYLHGPLLPKNAWFADWLIATALGIAASELAPLDDPLEDAAHAAARRAAGAPG